MTSSKRQAADVAPSGINVNVIATFNGRNQEFFDIELPSGMPKSQQAFVRSILDSMELDDVADLVKLSCCVSPLEKKDGSDREEIELPDWYMKRWGKWYFNTDVNKDEDTAQWHKFRNAYVKEEEEEKKE